MSVAPKPRPLPEGTVPPAGVSTQAVARAVQDRMRDAVGIQAGSLGRGPYETDGPRLEQHQAGLLVRHEDRAEVPDRLPGGLLPLDGCDHPGDRPIRLARR